MYKVIKVFTSVMLLLLFPLLFSVTAGAEETGAAKADLDDIIDPKYGQTEMLDEMPSEARDIMEETEPLELTFGAVMAEIWAMVKNEVTKPLKMFVSLSGVIMLAAAADALRDANGESGNAAVKTFEIVGVLAGAGIMSIGISESVTRASGTLAATGAFMLTLIPILAGIMAVMGQVASANLFGTAVIAAAQVFSQVMIMALMPLSASVLGISIAGAVSPDLKTERLAETVKKVVIWILGLLVTVFVGLLTVQSFVSGNADSVAMKAVKFTVSGGVPIIGSAVSDALGVVRGSVSVLKSTTGVFGLVAIAVICLPTLLSVMMFRLALTAAGAVSDIFGVGQLNALLKSGESVMSIITAMLVCFILIMLVSVALMIKVGGG